MMVIVMTVTPRIRATYLYPDISNGCEYHEEDNGDDHVTKQPVDPNSDVKSCISSLLTSPASLSVTRRTSKMAMAKSEMCTLTF